MANTVALRELQSRLAERLQAARTQQRGRSWLAVECGTRSSVDNAKISPACSSGNKRP